MATDAAPGDFTYGDMGDDFESFQVCQYRGRHPNLNHSLEHRTRFHLPVFLREVRRHSPPFFVEWWVSQNRWPAAAPPVTLVHYRPGDQLVRATLEEAVPLWNDPTEPIEQASPIYVKPDLANSALPNEVIVETLLPSTIDGTDHFQWRWAEGAASLIWSSLDRKARSLPIKSWE